MVRTGLLRAVRAIQSRPAAAPAAAAPRHPQPCPPPTTSISAPQPCAPPCPFAPAARRGSTPSCPRGAPQPGARHREPPRRLSLALPRPRLRWPQPRALRAPRWRRCRAALPRLRPAQPRRPCGGFPPARLRSASGNQKHMTVSGEAAYCYCN